MTSRRLIKRYQVFRRYFFTPFTHWPALQLVPLGQVPHSNAPPQPSLAAPQSKPCWTQVLGVQVVLAHVPALQLVPIGHMPHCNVPPQPSLAGPHCMPVGHKVAGVQVWAARGGGQASITSAIAVKSKERMFSSL